MKNFTAEVFWASGHFVSTVGLDEEMVRAYIASRMIHIKRRCATGVLLLLALETLSPRLVWGHGALAIGLPDDVAQDGLAIGVSWDMPTPDAARSQALQQCLDFKIAPEKTRALCRVIRTYRRQCVSIATDPEPGMAGWGWAIADTIGDADARALRLCRTTLLQFCLIAVAGCDTRP